MKNLPAPTEVRSPRGSDRIWLVVILQILLLVWGEISLHAQDLPGLYPKDRRNGQLLPLLEEGLPQPAPEVVLPEESLLNVRPSQMLPQKMVVREILIKGSTVFSEDDLERITAPYLNRELTNEILEEIRYALTLHYIQNGYVNSGAFIPDQEVVNGKITFQIIEGRISEIDLQGRRWFARKYIEDRILLAAGPPMNIFSLQKRLQQLQQDPRIASIHAELKPGIALGDSLMNLDIEENKPIQFHLGADNYQTPSVGAERGFITLAHQNFTGHGDILSMTGTKSEKNDPQADLSYSFPISSRDTTLTLRYRKNDLSVIEGSFDDLDIVSRSEAFQIGVRHPFYRSLATEFAMAIFGENSIHRTFLLGEPYSFSPGAADGKSVNTVLRFVQEWTYRTQEQVLSARSQFSHGIDALDATIHQDDRPDGRFFAWLGQFQWARILGFLDTQVLFRTELQLSSDSLLGMEQMAVGGRYSVRGYRENQIVRDEAFIGSAEIRIPLVQNKGWTDYLQAAAFFDFGEAWEKFGETPTPRNISSVGLGIRWAGNLTKAPFEIKPRGEIYWGCPLREVETPGGDLQDDGIHFQFVLQASF